MSVFKPITFSVYFFIFCLLPVFVVSPQGFTFLTGAAGVHAVGAAVAQRTGDMARCRRHAREVAAMEELGTQERNPFRIHLRAAPAPPPKTFRANPNSPLFPAALSAHPTHTMFHHHHHHHHHSLRNLLCLFFATSESLFTLAGSMIAALSGRPAHTTFHHHHHGSSYACLRNPGAIVSSVGLMNRYATSIYNIHCGMFFNNGPVSSCA